MTCIRRFAGLFLTTMFAGSAPVMANDQVTDIHPTTPYEYWHDYCGYPNVIPNGYEIIGGSLVRMLSAEATLVRVGQIEQRTDDPNFWRFTYTEDNIYYPGTTELLSGQVPFYGELKFAQNVRTGFLIAPDILATAPHTIDFNPSNFIVVFNLTAKKDPVTQACVPPDPEHIPASDVFFARASNPMIANTVAVYTPWGIDYGAYYLDRPATGHQYLRIRKTGEISPADKLAFAGHPFGLRTKLQFGIGYAGQQANPYFPGLTSYPIFDDYYTIFGMSGSAIFNLDRNYVEMLDSHGDLGCLGFQSGSNPTYHEMFDRCDDVRDAPYLIPAPPSHYLNEGPISTLADLVPTKYLRVDPLSDVVYVVPIGGTPNPLHTIYTATASSSETVSTSILAALGPTSVPSNEPSISLSSYATSLTPGASTGITATATVPTDTPCGIYDRSVTIIDQTHGFRDHMLHRFEVGMTDFSVTPDGATDIYGISAPSTPANVSYTVTNTRPTAVTLSITLSQSWLSFETGSSSTVTLAPAGQGGATQTVAVKPAAAAFNLSNGDYPFTVTFQAQGACALNAAMVRAGVFHKGVVRIRKSLDMLSTPPTPANAPLTDNISVVANFCVSDVRIRFDSLLDQLGTIGVPLMQWAPDLRIYLDFDGSQDVSSQLWNRDSLPPIWVIPTSADNYNNTETETFQMDRVQNIPPIGAGSLSAFSNRHSVGQWTFRLYDDGLPSRNTGILIGWELELRGGGNCFGGGGG